MCAGKDLSTYVNMNVDSTKKALNIDSTLFKGVGLLDRIMHTSTNTVIQ